MTRERWEQVLFAHVQDEVVQDVLNQYVLELEAENAKLREELDFCLKQVPNCDGCEAMLDCWECLRADSSQKERKRLDYENAKLRELVRDMKVVIWAYDEYTSDDDCPSALPLFEDRLRELGVEV